MKNENALVVEVPVTLKIAVRVPQGDNGDAKGVARALAQHAAHSLSHVSHARLDAFNETNRVHPHAAGEVTAVEAQVNAA